MLVLAHQIVVLFNGELGDLTAFLHGCFHIFYFTHYLPQFLAVIGFFKKLSSVFERLYYKLLFESQKLLEHLVHLIQMLRCFKVCHLILLLIKATERDDALLFLMNL